MAKQAATPRGARRKPVKKAGVPLNERVAAAVPWMLVGTVAAVLLVGVIYLGFSTIITLSVMVLEKYANKHLEVAR